MKKLLILFLFLIPNISHAAIAFDASTANITDGATTATYAHTVTGSNTVLLVGVMVGAGKTVSGVTYAGVSMTQVNTFSLGGATFDNFYMFRLVAPTTGTNNVVITASASTFIYSTTFSYTGVDQSTPIDVSGTNSTTGTSLGLTLTTTKSNAWLVGFWGIGAGADDNDFVAGANTTKRAGDTAPGIWFSGADSGAARTSGSNTITLTHSTSMLMGVIGVAIMPVQPIVVTNPILGLVRSFFLW